jgi:hypothetical protein
MSLNYIPRLNLVLQVSSLTIVPSNYFQLKYDFSRYVWGWKETIGDKRFRKKLNLLIFFDFVLSFTSEKQNEIKYIRHLEGEIVK